MDIEKVSDGICRRVPSQENRLHFEIPIDFVDLTSGPSGLEVAVNSIKLGKTFLTKQTDVEVASYLQQAAEGDKPPSLAGDRAKPRPVPFRDEGDDKNRLVFVFEWSLPAAQPPQEPTPQSDGKDEPASSLEPPAHPPSEADSTETPQDHSSRAQSDSEPKAEEARDRFEIALALRFTNRTRLDLDLLGSSPPDNDFCTIADISRAEPATLTLLNLGGLFSVALGLLAWNILFNSDVYESGATFGQKTIAAVTGSLLTFLGLSFDKLKSLFATITSTISFVRYPELHLSAALVRALGSRAFALFLILALATGLTVAWRDWSISAKLPNPSSKIALYDSSLNTLVTNDRVYRRALRSGDHGSGRFLYICAPRGTAVPSHPTPLAILGADGRQDVGYTFRFFKGAATEPDYELYQTGLQWILVPTQDKDRHETIRDILCGSRLRSDETREIAEDLYAGTSEIADVNRRVIDVRTSRLFLRDEVEEILRDHLEQVLADFDGWDLFGKRHEEVTAFGNMLAERFGATGVVGCRTLGNLSRRFLEEIGTKRNAEAQAVERSILLRAFWRETHGGRLDGRPDEEAKDVGTLVGDLLRKDYGWRTNRVLFELLFEIQSLYPQSVQETFHQMAVDSYLEREPDEFFTRLADYVVAGLTVGTLSPSQEEYLRANLQGLQMWIGLNKDPARWLVRREMAGPDLEPGRKPIDRSLDLGAIESRFREYAAAALEAGRADGSLG